MESVVQFLCGIAKVIAVFFFIRGVLYLAGFRYNIPIIDDFFWLIIESISTWAARPW